jgi:hypothetical protein
MAHPHADGRHYVQTYLRLVAESYRQLSSLFASRGGTFSMVDCGDPVVMGLCLTFIKSYLDHR